MSETILPPATYGIGEGANFYIKIIYPSKDIDNTRVEYNNIENTNFIYNVCRDEAEVYYTIGQIIMYLPLERCLHEHRDATITLKVLGSGPMDNPTRIDRIVEFI